MELLHPVAQVIAIIVVGAIIGILILAIFTEYFNKP